MKKKEILFLSVNFFLVRFLKKILVLFFLNVCFFCIIAFSEGDDRCRQAASGESSLEESVSVCFWLLSILLKRILGDKKYFL